MKRYNELGELYMQIMHNKTAVVSSENNARVYAILKGNIDPEEKKKIFERVQKVVDINKSLVYIREKKEAMYSVLIMEPIHAIDKDGVRELELQLQENKYLLLQEDIDKLLEDLTNVVYKSHKDWNTTQP